MTELECRSELVVRERRGDLSTAEQSALSAHLQMCASCRLTQRLGADFEQAAVLDPADGQRIAGLSEVARNWALGAQAAPERLRSRSRSRWSLGLVAACGLLVAFGASAALGVFEAPRPPAPSNTTPAPQAHPASKPAPVRAVVAKSEEAPAAAPVEKPVQAVARVDHDETAAELLERGSRARRDGNATQAIAVFRTLEQRFPSSAEARIAEVRLGGLLLTRGQARAALAEFDRHLAHGGGLAPEALYGKARALGALGDPSEREVLSALVRDYPASPYVGFAERRLRALGGEPSKTE